MLFFIHQYKYQNTSCVYNFSLFLLTINPAPVWRLDISPTLLMRDANYISILSHSHLSSPAGFQHVQYFAPGCVHTSVCMAEGIEKGLFFTLDSMRDLSTDVRNTAPPRQREMKSALKKQWNGRDSLKCML